MHPSSSPPSLPTELILIICEIAAQGAQGRSTAAALCLVSTWVRSVVDPILYTAPVLSLRNQSSKNITIGMLHSKRYLVQLEKLALFPAHSFGTIFSRSAFDALAAAKPKPRIRNLMATLEWGPLLEFEECFLPFLEELHIHYSCYKIELERWQHLQRVHIIFTHASSSYGGMYIWTVGQHQSLTHIALTSNISWLLTRGVGPYSAGYEFRSFIRYALDTAAYPSLISFVVRLFFDNEITRPAEVSAIVQPLEDKQALDPRLALILHSQDTTSEEKAYSEWEHNAERGKTIWDDIETSPAASSA